ncbi:unnamed protein product [Lampetra fluviatilis]
MRAKRGTRDTVLGHPATFSDVTPMNHTGEGTMTEATMGDGGGGGGDERRVAANEERNAPQRERVPQREIYREKSPSSFVRVLGLIARAGTMRRGAVGSERMGGA